MLNSTDLSRQMLGAEYEYRLYSGLSHGTPYAVNVVRGMYQSDDPQAAGAVYSFLLHPAADAYCRAVWAYAEFMGMSDRAALSRGLEEVYDDLRFKEEPRSYFRDS